MTTLIRRVLGACSSGCYFVKQGGTWRCVRCGASR